MSTTPREGDRTGVPAPPPPPVSASPAGSGTVRRSLTERLGADDGTRTAPSGAGERTQTRPAPAGSPRAEGTKAGQRAPGVATGNGVRPDRAGGPRRVRLTVSRVDPWSVMKLSFLLSVALGIMVVVASAMVWFVLDSMHVFADIEELLTSIGSENFLQLMDYLKFDRVMSFATIVGVVDVLLLTALGTIGAFLYNIVSALVGGLHVTLTDD